MHDHLVSIDPVQPEPGIIQTSGKILAENGIVIFPAKCLYGVAAHALHSPAVEKVFQIKQRPLDNPILVLVKNLAMVQSLVKHIPQAAHKLMDAFWPGSLTLIFHAREIIPEQLTAGSGKIGIRVPIHPVAKAIVEQVDFPITGTSANLSGTTGCTRIDQLPFSMLQKADLILDAGTLKGGKGSTVVDLTQTRVSILREGEISAKKILTTLA